MDFYAFCHIHVFKKAKRETKPKHVIKGANDFFGEEPVLATYG